jgi:hypothetical protein
VSFSKKNILVVLVIENHEFSDFYGEIRHVISMNFQSGTP